MLGMFTLIALGFLVLLFNPSIPIERQVADASGVVTTVHGAFAPRHLGRADPRRLPGHLPHRGCERVPLAAVTGLVASFHAIIFAYGPDLLAVAGGLLPRISCR